MENVKQIKGVSFDFFQSKWYRNALIAVPKIVFANYVIYKSIFAWNSAQYVEAEQNKYFFLS